MKYLAILSLSVFTVLGCNQKSGSQEDSLKQAASVNFENCYESLTDADTLKLSVISHGKNVTGSLMSVKSSNQSASGTFTGTQSADTLKVNLRSVESGKISFREIYWLRKNNQLYQATGEESKINDSTYVYKSPSAVTYSQNLIFKKIDCPKF